MFSSKSLSFRTWKYYFFIFYFFKKQVECFIKYILEAAHNSTTIASSFATIADAMAYQFFYVSNTTGIEDENKFTKNMTITDPINDSDQQNFATAFAEPVGKQQSPSTSRDWEFLPVRFL